MKLRMVQFCLILISSSFFYNGFALSWANIWLTKDQLAQEMINKGQFEEALKTFVQPEWQAAAAYRAGHYAQAAKQYQVFKNEHAYYNQGNALAQEHQYQQAIDAYNQALKINPKNQDALYNRGLIQELLNKSKNQKSENQQNQKQQSNPSNQQQGQEQPNRDQQNSNKPDQQKNRNQPDSERKQDDNSPSPGKQDRQDNEQQNKRPRQQDQNRSPKKKSEDLKQAPSAQEREQQEAKDQWLRLIPDDPGGLMREKFLRDYRRRHGGSVE